MPPAVDYILFSAAMLAGTIALHAWLRRRGDRGLTWPIWFIVLAVLGAGAIATERVDAQTRERLQRAVIGLAPTYAMEVERMGHAAIGLQTAADDPTYLRIIDAEKRWLAANPVVNDIYTFRPIDPTHVALIVDSETDYDHNGRYEGEREARTAIGEHFDLDSPYVSAAMAGRGGLDPVPAADRWGTWVSAFWPLRDAQGRVEAVLGVDYEASAWNREIRGARYAAMGVAAIVLLTLLAGSALFALQRIELVTRQSAAEAMRQARDAAESASRLKSEFLACMSHEIRTPMNGVMGVAELLLGTELQPRQRHFADLILRSATNLLAVINDILDYSKIEADKLVLEDIEFDPHEVVEDVGELLGGRAGAKGLELVVRLPQQSPGRVSGDAGRIRQVLTNLVGNAVKFTDSGEVEVTVRWLELASQRPTLRCEVRDTGPGMDAPTRAALFQPFMQADSSITRRFGGTGLGLAISRRLVTMMDGRIDCDSRPGQGSTFWFELPLRRARGDAAAQAATRIQGLGGLRALIVDDNDTNREILEHLLGAWGLRHASASGADEALRMLDAAHASGDGYALAILDQEMPGRDGVQLARAIRAHPALTGMRLVMLSSVSDTVAELRGADGGIDAFLTKPARQAALYREICRVLGVQQGDTALRASAPPAAEERLRFAGRALLAEDNAVNQLIARQMLESMGLQVDVAGDGRAAVEALRSAQLRYDVVLMDCEMPELDGRSATQQWRRIESTLGGQPRVPIIALTAHAADSDRLACLAAGMDDYLSKPMTRRQLGETLARWCRPLEAPPASGDMTERAPRAGAASG